jgi:hypothetical protein
MTEEEEDESAEMLYLKYVGERKGQWNNNSTDLAHILDNRGSGAYRASNKFDAMRSLPIGHRGKLFHVCYHNMSLNQHLIFDADQWTTIAQGLQSSDPRFATLYEEAEEDARGFLLAIQQENLIPVATLEAYLRFLHRKYCIQGNLFVDRSPGNKIVFSPHLNNRTKDNPKVYLRTEAARALLAHRNKVDRRHVYGHGQQLGKKARLLVFHQRCWDALQRVGLTNGDTLDIGSALIPMLVERVYDVDFNGDPGIHAATFTQIYSL